jgi:hypothetical protein
MVDCSGEKVKLVLVVINSFSGIQPVSKDSEQSQTHTTVTPMVSLLFMTLPTVKAFKILLTGMKK